MSQKRALKTKERLKAWAKKKAETVQSYMNLGTLRGYNRRVEESVDQKFQKVVASMTNWQRHQWNKHLRENPNHRKELSVAQAFANLDRATRAVKLAVAHG